MTMTRETIEELKRLAEKATPGPWMSGANECLTKDRAVEICKESIDATPTENTIPYFFEVFNKEGFRTAMVGNGPTSWENADFIAAANPQTILSLLALAERALEPQGEAHCLACAGHGASLDGSRDCAKCGGSGSTDATMSMNCTDCDGTGSQPQGQALPVAWQVWWGLMEKKPVWPPFATEDEAKQRAAQIKSNTEIRPLYASQLALPAGTVPEGWKDAIEAVRTRMENDTPSAYDNSGYREYAGVVLDAVEDQLHALASPSPAVAQPVADERAKPKTVAWLIESYDRHDKLSKRVVLSPLTVELDDTQEAIALCTVEDAEEYARAALGQPAEEGDKA